MYELGRDQVMNQFEYVERSGCGQVVHAGTRREPGPSHQSQIDVVQLRSKLALANTLASPLGARARLLPRTSPSCTT